MVNPVTVTQLTQVCAQFCPILESWHVSPSFNRPDGQNIKPQVLPLQLGRFEDLRSTRVWFKDWGI